MRSNIVSRSKNYSALVKPSRRSVTFKKRKVVKRNTSSYKKRRMYLTPSVRGAGKNRKAIPKQDRMRGSAAIRNIAARAIQRAFSRYKSPTRRDNYPYASRLKM